MPTNVSLRNNCPHSRGRTFAKMGSRGNKAMGRFETVAELYRYREPYSPEFFATVAARLALTQQTRMLDVGCGPGNLVLGFAPFVGSCTAIDPEAEMLRVARANAFAADLHIDFVESAIEGLKLAAAVLDFVTIGRAIHWLPRPETLAVLEQSVAPAGYIAICGSMASDSPLNAWDEQFKNVRRAWASDPDESRYKVDLDHWFSTSRFRKVDEIAVKLERCASMAELIGRALSFSVTSPAVLGERRPQFEAAVESALSPFATAGAVPEELLVKATVFARPAG